MRNKKNKRKKTEKKAIKAAPEEQAAPPPAEVTEIEPLEETLEEISPLSLDELEEVDEPTHVNDNIERILDIPITVAVEVGRVRMLINDLLQLGHGSVIELDKSAGKPMEILVNDCLVAKGEVVAINEKLGIRLTDIISPTERIKQLRK
jgi:flagellar motor switch protein FliN/FliY